MLKLGLTSSDYGILLAAVMLMLFVSLSSRNGSFRAKLAARPMMLRYAAYFLLFLVTLIFGAYGIGYDSNQFIYSRF